MNRQIVLSSIPEGMPSTDNFLITDGPVPEIRKGELLVKTRYLSVDPYMRGRMRSTYTSLPPFTVGNPLEGAGIAEVADSLSEEFKTGDLIKGNLRWQEFQTVDPKHFAKIGKYVHSPADHLSVLGLTGMTAYFGLMAVGKPVQGEIVAVSGAAGAVGSIAGQIAKIKGCKVIGIAGNQDKINYLKEELHFDEAFNYHDEHWDRSFTSTAPHGVDIYFDNVGGQISDVVMGKLNQKARIIICGQISLYNTEEVEKGPRIQPILLEKRALMQGFSVRNYADHFNEAAEDLIKWMREGKIKSKETILKGLEKLPEAFVGLFQGKNTGKSLVEI